MLATLNGLCESDKKFQIGSLVEFAELSAKLFTELSEITVTVHIVDTVEYI